MDWCSVYLTPHGLPKYIYLSPPLIFPTTYNGIRTKTRPVWITPGAAPIRWMGPIRNPRWEQKRNEGYVIVSKFKLLKYIFKTKQNFTMKNQKWNKSDSDYVVDRKLANFLYWLI